MSKLIEKAKFLYVEANVRYWEDADVNGVEDDQNNPKIPLRDGKLWKITIDLKEGKILDWPIGTTAYVHYKVCDAGEYWLLDENKVKFAKEKNYYVPDGLLCMDSERGFGDYIVLKIDENGFIKSWKPRIYEEDWELL